MQNAHSHLYHCPAREDTSRSSPRPRPGVLAPPLPGPPRPRPGVHVPPRPGPAQESLPRRSPGPAPESLSRLSDLATPRARGRVGIVVARGRRASSERPGTCSFIGCCAPWARAPQRRLRRHRAGPKILGRELGGVALPPWSSRGVAAFSSAQRKIPDAPSSVYRSNPNANDCLQLLFI